MRILTKKLILLFTVLLIVNQLVSGQDAMALVQKVKSKIEKVNDYSALGKLRTDVAFLKVPVATVQVYFKKPNQFKISKQKGISILPKGGVSVNMQNILAEDNFVALDAGIENVGGEALKVIKVLPASDKGDVVLTTLYIDEKQLLVKKVVTTTRENGTYEVNLTYGKYAAFALPDKTIFSFNTKDYKLPKGVTMEFDDGERPDANRLNKKKGFVEIIYLQYTINQGLPNGIFSK